jgi:hypothetical protein
LIRSPLNHTRPGVNVNKMLLFNDLIQHLDLVEVSFSGRAFTWSNMQSNALLEKLDWVFTWASWTLSFPDTKVLPLSRPSDHTPYVIQMNSRIPKSHIFIFENYWVQFDGFLDTVHLHWNSTPFYGDATRTLGGGGSNRSKEVSGAKSCLS